MKKILMVAAVAAACFCITACHNTVASTPPQITATLAPTAGPTAPTDTTTVPTTAPTGTTTVPATVPETTAPPILTGWQEAGGNTYYYWEDGTMATGWIELDGKQYYLGVDGALCTGWIAKEEGRAYLGEDGAMVTGWLDLGGERYYLGTDGILCTGWLELEGLRYYLGEHGAAVTGWQDLEGKTCYFLSGGAMAMGWQTIEDARYYFDAQGDLCTGWTQIGEDRYYLGEDGVVYTGWLEQDGKRYYLCSDGTMARGCVEIDGVKNYFTSTGAPILLVNPWNYVPEGYDPELVDISSSYCFYGGQVSAVCYDALLQMLKDCEAQCFKPVVVSAYRTNEFQTQNYQRKVTYYKNLGYSQEEAEILAAKEVAVPGTSEHQLGLAVDIVDNRNWSLNDSQADTPVQKWLMEHCWEYGFILRYPKDKTDVTGIIYEPWHYRYVGLEVAAELHESGLTLEEYLDSLTEKE